MILKKFKVKLKKVVSIIFLNVQNSNLDQCLMFTFVLNVNAGKVRNCNSYMTHRLQDCRYFLRFVICWKIGAKQCFVNIVKHESPRCNSNST